MGRGSRERRLGRRGEDERDFQGRSKVHPGKSHPTMPICSFLPLPQLRGRESEMPPPPSPTTTGGERGGGECERPNFSNLPPLPSSGNGGLQCSVSESLSFFSFSFSTRRGFAAVLTAAGMPNISKQDFSRLITAPPNPSKWEMSTGFRDILEEDVGAAGLSLFSRFLLNRA